MTEAIHGKMASILKDMDAIGKNAENKQQGFKYRGIDDVYNAINPVLAKHGVYMTAEIVGKTREERASKSGGVLAFTSLHMRYHFRADDGSSVATEAEGEGMDSGDKSSNKAMAIAHKYALLQAFCIPTKDLVDPDAEVHEIAAPEGVKSPPNGDRKAAANKWGNDALKTIEGFRGGDDFNAWHRTNRNAIAAVREFNEALHGRLVEAVRRKNTDFAGAPLAAE